jgi:hypothetical protein
MNAVALLLALLVSLTGIDRTVDPGLTAIAERRVVEISACPDVLEPDPATGELVLVPGPCWSHDGSDPCCNEVLAFNSGYADPVTHLAEQWQGSPVHWAILTDPGYTAIGCAVAFVENRAYAACVLAGGGQPATAPSPPPPPPPGLPDTAMEAP